MDYTSEKWNDYWSRPYSRYEAHQKWFWDNAFPFIISPVLDLGCGPASMWKGTTHDVTGVDYSATAIKEAQKNYPKGKFSVADITTYTPDASFNTVVSFGVVHYFLPKKLNLIRDAHVKPAKQRIVFTLNTPADLNLFKDWGTLEYAKFQNRIGWIVVLSVIL